MPRHNKLVRDKIPEIIARNGEQAIVRQLDGEEYLRELVKKLGEECQEFQDAQTIEELADVQEVVLALADIIANRQALEETRRTKAAKRGSFEQRVFLEKTI